MRDKTRKTIRAITLSGLFIALGIVLPIALHASPNVGKIFLPMFLPVLLSALFLPWQFALAVGVITPLLSGLLTGMPPMAPLPMNFMLAAELGLASVVIALLKNVKWIKQRKFMVVFALIPALLLGFGMAGVVLKIATQFFGIKGPGMWTYIIGAIVAGLPGIAIQIVVIPLLYSLISKREIQVV